MIPAAVVPPGAAGQAYEKAASTILCDCGCHPQSTKECACTRAEEMRTAIAAEAASGKSGEAIIAGYVAKYGQKILISPEASGFNLVAWVGPGVGILAAALVISLAILRWRRTPPTAPPASLPGPSSDDAAYRARLAADVEDLR
jgi:cytochrome c-type biogenesis protein CcmH/NrfF